MTIYTNNYDVTYENGRIVRISADISRGKFNQTRILLDDTKKNKTGVYAYLKLIRASYVNEEKYKFSMQLENDSAHDLKIAQNGRGVAFRLKIRGTSGEPLFFIKER